MTKTITYRSFRATDIKPLAKIIQETWFDGKWKHPWIAYHLSLILLYHTLIRHDYSNVAVMNGKAVGIVLGRNKQAPMVHQLYRFAVLLLSMNLFLYKEGREGLKELSTEHSANKKLFNEVNESFDSELILFIVGKEARGTGVGSSLFQTFLDYQQLIGASSFYLYTDDSCTYQFYERKGLERAATYPIDDFNFYLYKGKA